MQKMYLVRILNVSIIQKLALFIMALIFVNKSWSSTPTDYFRSIAANGFWNSTASWESSPDNIIWSPATLVPTSSANIITITAGNVIRINTSISLDETIVDGTIDIETGGILNINDGNNDDIIITSGGVVNLKSSSASAYNIIINKIGSANFNINTGGKISIIGNGSSVPGGAIGFATDLDNIWNNGAIFEWNCSSGTMGFSGLNFFPNVNSTTIPIFRVSATFGAPGGGTPTTINGIFEVNTNLTLIGGAAKNFRNGIRGNSTLTQNNTSGNSFVLLAANAILDGPSLNIVLSSPLNLSTSTQVPLGAFVTVSGSSIRNSSSMLTINGTLDITTISITNTGGSVIVNGTIRTANSGGLSGTLSSIPSGIVSLNTLSNVDYYSSVVNQVVTSRSDYYNLNLSGALIKTPSGTFNPSGTITISGSTTFDCSGRNIGNASTSLTMTGGRLIVSTTGTQPSMSNTYNLSGGVIQFDGSNQTIRNETYQNIEVTGSDVSNSSGNITLNNLGSFTIKSGGSFTINDDGIIGPTGIQTVTIETGGFFKTGDIHGFAGGTGATSTSVRNDIENLILQSGSTVEYSKATGAGQIITNSGVTNPLTGNYYNLTLSGSGVKTAPSTNLTLLGNLVRSATSTFNANSGRVIFQGSTSQIYSDGTGLPPLEFYNLRNSNEINLIVNNTFAVQNEFNLTPPAKLNLNTGDIILRSTPARTAYITDLGTLTPSNNISYDASGRFNIERNLQPIKSWRLLATPIQTFVNDPSSPTINNSWRENISALSSTGYGTRITGPGIVGATGVDEATQRGSMKYYNMGTNSYVEITGADMNGGYKIANDAGYYTFIRGDRGVAVNDAAGATTLRMSGKLRTGNQTFTVNPNGFQSVGNPFASQIDFKATTKNNIVESFYVWNPFSSGSYNVGAFEVYVKELVSPFDYRKNGSPVGAVLNTIESGQAFFIQSIPGGSIVIKEADKTTGTNAFASRETNDNRAGVTTPTLEINLHTNDASGIEYLADAAIINFDNIFSNAIDVQDVKKISNSFDNLGIKKTGLNLVVERRPELAISDTINLNIAGMRLTNYRFEIDPSVLNNLPLAAFLKDKFLQTETPVSLTAVTNVNFSITNDPASRVADRFMIVFRAGAAGPLPVSFTSISADKNADKTNTVKWNCSNEINISNYSVERSTDGTTFTTIGTTAATANNGNSAAYIFVDAAPVNGINYYRVKAISVSGQLQYSAIVKVLGMEMKPQFEVRPNPVTNKTLHINFVNMVGNHNMKLVSKQGATVFTKQITVSSINEMKNIVASGVAAGMYEIILADTKGKTSTQTIYIN